MGNKRTENINRGYKRMMKIFFVFIICTCLVLIFLQDIKYRSIHILLPVGVFVISGTLLYQKLGGAGLNFVFNNVVLFIAIFFGMVLYMSIKKGVLENPFRRYFGLGDLLFYVSITPLFSVTHYLLYFILSMIFAILLSSIFRNIIKSDSIPLAGFSALLLIGFFILQFFSFNSIIIAF